MELAPLRWMTLGLFLGGCVAQLEGTESSAGAVHEQGVEGDLPSSVDAPTPPAPEPRPMERPATTITQTYFDFTLEADRAHFVEDGLAFVETVGPYAIYEVTTATPRLVGPRIAYAPGATAGAMLCGASVYFDPAPRADGTFATIRLRGGADAEEPIIATAMAPLRAGDCGFHSDASSPRREGAPSEEWIALTVEPAPSMGTRVALRMVSLDPVDERTEHLASAPRLCCYDEYCAIQ